VTPTLPPVTFTVTFNTVDGSTNSSSTKSVVAGETTHFEVLPKSGYTTIVTGCNGALSGTTYTTAAVLRDCTVNATFVAVPTGDLNGDNTVTIADSLLALQFAVGLKIPTAADLAKGDVAPFVGGKSMPDGKIDIADAVALLQKSVGLLNW
jgi:hypothetical protein